MTRGEPRIELEDYSKSMRVILSQEDFPGMLGVLLIRKSDYAVVSMSHVRTKPRKERKRLEVSAILTRRESPADYQLQVDLSSGKRNINLSDFPIREIQYGFVSRDQSESGHNLRIWINRDALGEHTRIEHLGFFDSTLSQDGSETQLEVIAMFEQSRYFLIELLARNVEHSIKRVAIKVAGVAVIEMSSDWPVWNRGEGTPGLFEDFLSRCRLGTKSRPRSLEPLSNSCRGKRAWIIGNGPSVRYADLNKIAQSGDLVFAFNRFHLSYSNHDLREDYLISTDLGMLRDFGSQMLNESSGVKIFGGKPLRTNHLLGDFIGLSLNPGSVCEFSLSPQLRISEGGAAPFLALQIARYMGIERIFLYGIDLSFTIEPVYDPKGRLIAVSDGNHFIADYRSNRPWYPPNWWNIGRSFLAARLQFEIDGARVINTTRGGRLEIFERETLENVL